MMNAKKSDWVLIHNIVLSASERAPQVPDDTKSVPLEMWVRGFIQHDGKVGDEVEIDTITGRRVGGKLIEVNPTYGHSFGSHVPEILQIGIKLKSVLFGGESHE